MDQSRHHPVQDTTMHGYSLHRLMRYEQNAYTTQVLGHTAACAVSKMVIIIMYENDFTQTRCHYNYYYVTGHAKRAYLAQFIKTALLV